MEKEDSILTDSTQTKTTASEDTTDDEGESTATSTLDNKVGIDDIASLPQTHKRLWSDMTTLCVVLPLNQIPPQAQVLSADWNCNYLCPPKYHVQTVRARIDENVNQVKRRVVKYVENNECSPKWLKPDGYNCKNCRKRMKLVDLHHEEINWLYLYLTECIALVGVEPLRFFFRCTGMEHEKKSMDELVPIVYARITSQLYPDCDEINEYCKKFKVPSSPKLKRSKPRV